jgi:rhodanese-related sulfurtransferase
MAARWFHEARGEGHGRRGALAAGLALLAGAGGAAVLTAREPPDLPDPAASTTTLAALERAVFRRHPGPELEPAGLLARRGGPLALFDLRGAAEHAAGHVEGAAWLDAFTRPEAFVAAHGAAIRGRTVVLMDLIGARSASLLAALRPAWRAAPPAAAYSLRGGVLRWWAEGHPLGGGGALRLPPGGWDALAARLSSRR